MSVEVQDIHPRLTKVLQSFLWKSSLEGPKFRAEYVKTFPDGVVGPRWIRGVVLETKFWTAYQHCVFYGLCAGCLGCICVTANVPGYPLWKQHCSRRRSSLRVWLRYGFLNVSNCGDPSVTSRQSSFFTKKWHCELLCDLTYSDTARQTSRLLWGSTSSSHQRIWSFVQTRTATQSWCQLCRAGSAVAQLAEDAIVLYFICESHLFFISFHPVKLLHFFKCLSKSFLVISLNTYKKLASMFDTTFTPGWLALGTQRKLLKFPGAQANLAVELQRSLMKAMGMEKQIQILCLDNSALINVSKTT